MAYLAFDSVATIDRTYKVVGEVINAATEYAQHRDAGLVKSFA
jgi:hypothetical protein